MAFQTVTQFAVQAIFGLNHSQIKQCHHIQFHLVWNLSQYFLLEVWKTTVSRLGGVWLKTCWKGHPKGQGCKEKEIVRPPWRNVGIRGGVWLVSTLPLSRAGCWLKYCCLRKVESESESESLLIITSGGSSSSTSRPALCLTMSPLVWLNSSQNRLTSLTFSGRITSSRVGGLVGGLLLSIGDSLLLLDIVPSRPPSSPSPSSPPAAVSGPSPSSYHS